MKKKASRKTGRIKRKASQKRDRAVLVRLSAAEHKRLDRIRVRRGAHSLAEVAREVFAEAC